MKTSESYLVLVNVHYDGRPTVEPYQAPPLPVSAQRHFQAGPGEALPMFSVTLSFEGVIRVDGELLRSGYSRSYNAICSSTLSVSPRRNCIMFSTKNPPSIQRIPWPSLDDEFSEGYEELEAREPLSGHDTWILNDYELPWLINSNGMLSKSSLLIYSFD